MRTSACFHLFPAFNPLNAELNPICHLLALLGGATIVVVSRLRVKYMDLCLHSNTIPRVVHSEDFLFAFLQSQRRIVTNEQDKGQMKIIMMSLITSFGTLISGRRIENDTSWTRKQEWKGARLKPLHFWTTSNVKYLIYKNWFHVSENGGLHYYIRYTKVESTLFKHRAIFKEQPKSSDSSFVLLLIIWRIFTLWYCKVA